MRIRENNVAAAIVDRPGGINFIIGESFQKKIIHTVYGIFVQLLKHCPAEKRRVFVDKLASDIAELPEEITEPEFPVEGA